MVRPGAQFLDGVPREEFRSDALARGLFGDGLRAVLTELECGSVCRLGPGAPRAVEASILVDLEERLGGAQGTHLRQAVAERGIHCAPAASRLAWAADPGFGQGGWGLRARGLGEESGRRHGPFVARRRAYRGEWLLCSG